VQTEQAAPSPNLEVRIRVRRRSGAKPDRASIRKALTAALANEGVTGDALVTLSFVDEEEIGRSTPSIAASTV